MYIPSAFRVEDPAKLAAFIRQYSFATLITQDAGVPVATHVPMLYDPHRGEHGTLISHMARANPQWQHFASGAEILAIFHGPHSYISPSWYETSPAVPTWNYAAVHAYGVPTLITDHDRVVSLLADTIAEYETIPGSADIPHDMRDKLIHALVAFEIPVTRIQGKFKLGQNRSAADIAGVISALSRSTDSGDQSLARLTATECGQQEAIP